MIGDSRPSILQQLEARDLATLTFVASINNLPGPDRRPPRDNNSSHLMIAGGYPQTRAFPNTANVNPCSGGRGGRKEQPFNGQTFSLSTHLSPLPSQTHRTVVTNPEWSTCFGTALNDWGQDCLSDRDTMRHYEKGCISIALLFARCAVHALERDGGGGTANRAMGATASWPLGHSSAHPSLRSLGSKDASMHGLWPSGPPPPTPIRRKMPSCPCVHSKSR